MPSLVFPRVNRPTEHSFSAHQTTRACGLAYALAFARQSTDRFTLETTYIPDIHLASVRCAGQTVR